MLKHPSYSGITTESGISLRRHLLAEHWTLWARQLRQGSAYADMAPGRASPRVSGNSIGRRIAKSERCLVLVYVAPASAVVIASRVSPEGRRYKNRVGHLSMDL